MARRLTDLLVSFEQFFYAGGQLGLVFFQLPGLLLEQGHLCLQFPAALLVIGEGLLQFLHSFVRLRRFFPFPSAAPANSCSSILGGISNSAYSWGADICIEMASVINNNAWRVTNAASNLANAVSNIVGFSIPKEGPLSDADECMPDFMKLMAEGIRKSSKMLVASVRELASSVGGAFTGLSLPEIGAGQLAMAGAGGGSVVNNTRSIGSLQVVVNGYNARNDNDLADTVVHRINEMLNEDSRVWGK